jgi:TetR/AcrR family transcriptional regulator
MPSTPVETPAPRRPGRPFKASADAASAIRKAALKSFSDFGFAGASIVDIAKAAGVAKPLIHYHFVSKDALWQAAVADAFGDLQTELTLFQAQLMALPPLDAVRQMAKQLVVFASRHPQLVRIVMDETGKGGPRGEWLHENFLLPGYQLSKGIIDGLSQQLQLGDKAPAAEHLVPIVLGVMNFAFLDASIIRKAYGADVNDTAYVERHGELLFTLLESVFFKAARQR